MRSRRAGIGEIASSLSMLGVTIALLGSLSVVSLQSIRSATQLLSDSSRQAEAQAGVLLRVVDMQPNSTGTYVWFYDYGWQGASMTSVYVNGGILPGWSSTCDPVRAGAICVARLPPSVQGNVTVFFGGRTIAIPL